jgi:hypothetical protein
VSTPKQPRIQEQPLPYSNDAEQGVLSSIFISAGKVIPACLEKIETLYFYVPAHQTIYQNLVDTWEAGSPIDLLTFCERLGEKVLKAVGGRAFLTRLAIDYVPTADNVEYYLDIVRAKYQLRQIIVMNDQAAKQAHQPLADDDGGPEALLDQMEAKIISIRSLGRNGANAQDAAQAIAKAIELPPDVVHGVLHLGGKAAIGGASKARKTWLFIDIAVSVGTGSVCLNNFPTTKGRVLYANFELPEPFFWKRVQAICDERQLTLEPGMLEVHHLRGRLQDWLHIEPRITPGKYSLIILDPSYKLLLLQSERLREENSSGVVATLLERFDRLAMRTGAAVAFGAHFSKGDQSKKEAIDRISGSGVFARDPDTIIIFTELTTADCYAVEMTLRNHPPVEKFAMRWEYPLFIPDVSLDPARLKQRKGAAEAIYQPEQLLEVLTFPMFAAQWAAAAYDKFEMSASTFKRLRYKLEAMGAIKNNNRKWRRNKRWKPPVEE